MKKRILLLGVYLFTSLIGLAQGDAYFSQYNSSPLQLNPANAGLFHGNFRFNGNFRRQWENVGTAFQTIGASCDFQIAKDVFKTDMFGMGISVIQDKAGVSSYANLHANLSGSYTKILDAAESHFFTLGASAAYGQKSLATSSLRWGTQWTDIGFDNTLPNKEAQVDESVSYLDLGAGINWFHSNDRETFKAYSGFAVFHLNEPEVTYLSGQEKIYRKYIFNGGLEYVVARGHVAFLPSLMHVNHGPVNFTQFGSDIKFILSPGTRMTGFLSESTFSLGLYHRWADAFIPAMKLQKGGFTLGVSYDFQIGNVTRINNGMEGPEFSLTFKTGYKRGVRHKPVNSKFM